MARPDEHASGDGGYTIRSMYFDNYMDKAITDKLSGQSRREKFRLRYYNGNTSFIRLERKSKANRLAYKEDAEITAEQCAEILAGRFECLNCPETPLMMELYTKMRYQNLRPKNIVDYHREAYVFPAGNVRVTFDSRIRMSNAVSGFLNPQLTTIPAASAIVLEIKYDGFLPDIMRDLLQISFRNQTEFSKYVVARLV